MKAASSGSESAMGVVSGGESRGNWEDKICAVLVDINYGILPSI